MAVILEGGCRVSMIREGEPRIAGTLKIWRHVGRDVGARDISLRVLEYGRGVSAMLRNPGCDELIYVLEGTATIIIDDLMYELQPEVGIYVRPNQAFSVQNPNPTPVVLISSQCPEPDCGPEISHFSRDDAESTLRSPLTGTATNPIRPSISPLVRLADRESLPTADRWYRVLVDHEVGCHQATQFVGSIPPGRAPDHFHLYEEVLFILRGEGRMWAGKRSTAIAAGSCVYLPKRQVHCVENTSTGELRLLGVFYPAGSPAVRYDSNADE